MAYDSVSIEYHKTDRDYLKALLDEIMTCLDFNLFGEICGWSTKELTVACAKYSAYKEHNAYVVELYGDDDETD